MALYPEWIAPGIAALVYVAAMSGVAIWLAMAAQRSRLTNALLLFAVCVVLMWGSYGITVLMVAYMDVIDDLRFVHGMAGVFRIASWLVLPAWIYLAMTIAPRPGVRLLPVGAIVLIGTAAGFLNYLNVSLAPWAPTTAIAIQTAPPGVVAILILIYVVRVRHKTAPGTVARRRANAYLLAFAVHDLVILALFSYLALNFALASAGSSGGFEPPAVLIAVSLLVFIFIPSLVYSVATGRLLDFERRAHFTLSRGTLAAFFVSIFVAAQTFVSEFFTTTAGLAAGAMAAGALVFAFTPLQNLAEQLADRAVPQGRASGKLTATEKEAFYLEQVEIAYSDGVIGPKERSSLKSMRERLGLSADVALRIEDSVAV